MGQREDQQWRENEAQLAEQARVFLREQGMAGIAGTLFRVSQGPLTMQNDFNIVKALERVFTADALVEAAARAAEEPAEEPEVPSTDADFNAALAERNAELQRIGVQQRSQIEQLEAELKAKTADMETLRRSIAPAE